MKQRLHQGEEEALCTVEDHHNPNIDIVFLCCLEHQPSARELVRKDRWEDWMGRKLMELERRRHMKLMESMMH
jgi:hypothetical protein